MRTLPESRSARGIRQLEADLIALQEVRITRIIKQPEYRERFDYVFVGSGEAHPKAHAYVRSAELAFERPTDGVWASDHFGLVVDLEIGRDE